MTLTDAQLQHYREAGYLITDALFDAATLGQLKKEFDRLWQEEASAPESQEHAATLVETRQMAVVGRVHARSEFCARFCRGPVFQDICRALIGPDVDLYYNQAVIKPPSASGAGKPFAWHQDSGYGTPEPLEGVTCWVAVSDATVLNGTIWVAPRLHRNGLLPHQYNDKTREWQCQPDESGKIPVEMKAGQLAVFSSLLPHCSGPNNSAATRDAYVVQFNVAGTRSRDTQELAGDQFPILRDGVAVQE